MWELEVHGNVDDIYRLLTEAFEEQHVGVVVDDHLDVKTPATFDEEGHEIRPARVSRRGLRTHTEEGVSEQFRCIAKSLQVMAPQLKGKVTVRCGGDPGKSMWMNVEVV